MVLYPPGLATLGVKHKVRPYLELVNGGFDVFSALLSAKKGKRIKGKRFTFQNLLLISQSLCPVGIEIEAEGV